MTTVTTYLNRLLELDTNVIALGHEPNRGNPNNAIIQNDATRATTGQNSCFVLACCSPEVPTSSISSSVVVCTHHRDTMGIRTHVPLLSNLHNFLLWFRRSVYAFRLTVTEPILGGLIFQSSNIHIASSQSSHHSYSTQQRCRKVGLRRIFEELAQEHRTNTGAHNAEGHRTDTGLHRSTGQRQDRTGPTQKHRTGAKPHRSTGRHRTDTGPQDLGSTGSEELRRTGAQTLRSTGSQEQKST